MTPAERRIQLWVALIFIAFAVYQVAMGRFLNAALAAVLLALWASFINWRARRA
jgi:hypothetical protein